jgi:geranyl-CoA carboxylase alpha subunit
MAVLSRDGATVRYRHGSVLRQALAVQDGGTLHLSRQGATFSFSEPSPYPANDKAADPSRARAPVAGVVAQVAVAVGDSVVAGQPLVCVEAMKMEMWLNAAAAGTVRAVHVKTKDSVASGAVLVEIDITE